MPDNHHPFAPELAAAVRAAEAAGAITLEKFGELSDPEIHDKEFRDFVTETDRACEAAISAILAEAFPDDGLLSEEGTTRPARSGRRWIVDPLDGTLNFIHSLPVFAISIGLQEVDGELLAGVVHLPVLRETFTASRNGGAFLNGRPIRVSQRQEPDGLLVATGIPFKEYGYLDAYTAMMQDVIRHTAGIRRAGAAAIDLAWTACGRFDGFWEYFLHPWDFAAGILLVREAGGIVTDFTGDGQVFRRQSIIAGTPATHPMLLEKARARFPEGNGE